MTTRPSVAFDPVFGCELVTAPLDSKGYGRDGTKRAHVAAWERANGPVADDVELDHLCRRRNCRALHHLELVTRGENERRKSLRYRLRRTKCPRGHDLTGANRVVVGDTGGVVCRICNQEARSR